MQRESDKKRSLSRKCSFVEEIPESDGANSKTQSFNVDPLSILIKQGIESSKPED